MDWVLLKHEFVKGGFVKHGFVKRGFVVMLSLDPYRI